MISLKLSPCSSIITIMDSKIKTTLDHKTLAIFLCSINLI
jgi:hypothetical protein